MSPSPMDLPDGAGLACTCSAVRGAARRLTQYYDDALRETGLKVTQYALLAKVARLDRPSVTDLAEKLDMDRTTLTRNLSPLRAAGWVRLATGADRRSRSVELTPEGRLVLENARPYWRAAELRLRERAGSDITGTLHALLSDTLAAVDAQQAQ